MSPEIQAAGGLLERVTEAGLRIAIVHRHRYAHRDGGAGDWVLPKGKLRAGENLEEAAVREVLEETGYRARIQGQRFPCRYVADGTPKVVTFFRMSCGEQTGPPDPSEVAEVVWVSPAEARERLTYDSERDVVRRAYGDEGEPGCSTEGQRATS